MFHFRYFLKFFIASDAHLPGLKKNDIFFGLLRAQMSSVWINHSISEVFKPFPSDVILFVSWQTHQLKNKIMNISLI